MCGYIGYLACFASLWVVCSSVDCLKMCNCSELTPEGCRLDQRYVYPCKCCSYCLPPNLRCAGFDSDCYPIRCTDDACWCIRPDTNERIGPYIIYRHLFSLLDTCEDLWFFANETLNGKLTMEVDEYCSVPKEESEFYDFMRCDDSSLQSFKSGSDRSLGVAVKSSREDKALQSSTVNAGYPRNTVPADGTLQSEDQKKVRN